jgi:hypothetical protein
MSQGDGSVVIQSYDAPALTIRQEDLSSASQRNRKQLKPTQQ